MGRGPCRVIPSYVLAAVRHEFPEADDVYAGFKLAELVAYSYTTYAANICFHRQLLYIQYLNNYNLACWFYTYLKHHITVVCNYC